MPGLVILGLGNLGNGHQQLGSFEGGLAWIDAVKVSGCQRDERVEAAVATFPCEEFLIDARHLLEVDRIPTGMTLFGRDVMIVRPASKLVFRQLGIESLTGEGMRLGHDESVRMVGRFGSLLAEHVMNSSDVWRSGLEPKRSSSVIRIRSNFMEESEKVASKAKKV